MENEFFEGIISGFSKLTQVDSVVLGGSRATGNKDLDSDYDVYMYLNAEVSPEVRQAILAPYCDYMEINNTYWEPEDDCKLKDGTVIEIIYRSLQACDERLNEILIKGKAARGYTTCICHNVFSGKVLYDKAHLYKALTKKYTMPYPKLLKQNIILKNRQLLQGKIPSYFDQIMKAIKRQDLISINHRIAEFLASYFDILFAFNEVYHIGEKRLLTSSLKCCKRLPINFEEELNKLVQHKEIERALNSLINNLDLLLYEEAEGV